MNARCEPPAELRNRNGWHWLKYGGDRNRFLPDPALWKRNYWEVCGAKYSVTDACGFGWRYLAPVLTPAEVEALRTENARLRAALKVAATTGLIGPGGIINADVLEIMQRTAADALTGSTKP
jgi:hypothetical protein